MTTETEPTETVEICRAESDADILACFDVLRQLRPHLVREDFVARIRRMAETDSYHLACARAGAAAGKGAVIVAVAGYRLATYLAWGPILYVDDLVTAETARSCGYGRAMLVWLRREASDKGCRQLHLDSGVWRKDAHRFYEREDLDKVAYHFATGIEDRGGTKGEDR